MICSACNTLNAPDARFCKACGHSLKNGHGADEEAAGDMKAVAWYMGWLCALTVFYLLLNRLIRISFIQNYVVFYRVTNVVSVIAILIFLIALKNKTLRILVSIMLALNILILFGDYL